MSSAALLVNQRCSLPEGLGLRNWRFSGSVKVSAVSPNDLALGICYLYFEVNPSESSKLEMLVIPPKKDDTVEAFRFNASDTDVRY